MSATEVWRNEAPSCRRKEGASFGQPSNQKLRQLPEEGAGGRRKEPEEGGRSSEEGGRSFEEGGRSFEEGGRSFEEGGRSFEAQASGRGRRQEGASLSWPAVCLTLANTNTVAYACISSVAVHFMKHKHLSADKHIN